MHRLYTWEVTPPADREPEDTLEGLQKAATRVATYNPQVEGSEVTLTPEGAIEVTIHFTGRDQWWIKRRVVYAITPILIQSKVPPSHARLVRVERPQDRRASRDRASDGRHNPLPEDQDIDHSDMGLVIS